MSKQELRFRQVHLDFHTSPDIHEIGDEFDMEEFASTLKTARVNSITCFARCHHGMLYYDSKRFPGLVHPNLKNRSLLEEQVEACHRQGIRVPIYTTVMWDEHMANEHPEWLALDDKGNVITWNSLYEPGFYRFLCLNSPYRSFLKEHVGELLEMFQPADGLFFDILFLTDCSCKYCRQKMKTKGYDPIKKEQRLQFAAETLDEFMLDMTSFIRKYNADCSIFYNSSHMGPTVQTRINAYSHFELESLPSGGWGYMHFPVTARFARNQGLDCVGLTGKFHTEWGDFHSFKNKAALEYECFRMLALNSKCMIGDQLEPKGRLSKPVYELIGSVYSSIEKKEPWCTHAKAVTDIGVLTPEEFCTSEDTGLPASILGATAMLAESGHQFDIIDSKSDFSRYKVLILPDHISVSGELARKFEKYIEAGGAMIASFESGLNIDKKEFAVKELGVTVKANITRDTYGEPVKGKVFPRAAYADYILPKGDIARGLPQTEHVMYIKGLEVEALCGSEVLAEAVLPYFDRTYEHFCSHRQAPSSGKAGYAGIVRTGRVIYFAHPIFTQYRENAPRWCKQLLLNALEMLLPEPVLRHNGPSTLEVTINEQKKENRWVVHTLHYIPQRRCVDIDIIEDVIPLYNIKLSVRVPGSVSAVSLVPERNPLAFERNGDRIEFIVPEIKGHRMIELQLEE